jgi:hypothetical protein
MLRLAENHCKHISVPVRGHGSPKSSTDKKQGEKTNEERE